MSKKDEIIMGAGELYMVIFNGTEIPSNEEIETEGNNVGHCQGGFSIDYKPEVYDVKNQYNTIVRRFTIGEEITTKTGILTWDLGRLAMLSTARFVVDAAKKVRKLIFGGKNPLATVLVRFVHTKENGKKIRWTTIAQGGNGFALEFSGDKELTIDAELASIEKNKGWLGEFEEELSDEEIAALECVFLESSSLGIAGNGKVTGLTSGRVYKVTTGSTIKYTKADGTLTTASGKAALEGTEITGLENGKTYMIEEDTNNG